MEKDENGAYTINGPKFMNKLAEKMGWRTDGRISFSGKWAREGMIAFDLTLNETATAV